MANSNNAGSGAPSGAIPKFGQMKTLELAAALALMGGALGADADRKLADAAANRLEALDAALERGRLEAEAAGKPGPIGELPLVLEGIVHLTRNKKLHEIKGPVFVDETDLTADEIDELTALRVIRLATVEEVLERQKRAPLATAAGSATAAAE